MPICFLPQERAGLAYPSTRNLRVVQSQRWPQKGVYPVLHDMHPIVQALPQNPRARYVFHVLPTGRVWRLEKGRESLIWHPQKPLAAYVRQGRLALLGEDTRWEPHPLPQEQAVDPVVAWSPTGEWLLALDRGGERTHLWHVPTRSYHGALHDPLITNVHWLPNGRVLLRTDAHGLYALDLSSRERRRVLSADRPPGDVHMQVTPRSLYMALASNKEHIRILEGWPPQEVRTLRYLHDQVRWADVPGVLLLYDQGQQTLLVLDGGQEHVFRPPGHIGRMAGSLRSHGPYVLFDTLPSTQEALWVVDLKSMQDWHLPLPTPSNQGWMVHLPPSPTPFLSLQTPTRQGPLLAVLDLQRRRWHGRPLSLHPHVIGPGAVWHPRGRGYVVTRDDGRTLWVDPLGGRNQEAADVLIPPDVSVTHAWFRDGRRVLTVSDRRGWVWDTRTGKTLSAFDMDVGWLVGVRGAPWGILVVGMKGWALLR